MTYRGYIQKQIEEIEIIYRQAGWIRDVAVGSEKTTWNEIRNVTRMAAQILRKLDDSLDNQRAGMELDK